MKKQFNIQNFLTWAWLPYNKYIIKYFYCIHYAWISSKIFLLSSNVVSLYSLFNLHFTVILAIQLRTKTKLVPNFSMWIYDTELKSTKVQVDFNSVSLNYIQIFGTFFVVLLNWIAKMMVKWRSNRDLLDNTNILLRHSNINV